MRKLFALALLLPLIAVPGVLAAGASYASYQVTASGPMYSFQAVVNETSTPVNANTSDFVFTVTSSLFNLSYSKSVNMSLFPVIPSVPNESFSFTYSGYAVNATHGLTGYTQVSFNGASYRLTDYALTGSIVSSKGSFGFSAKMSVFPSRLLYSLEATVNSTYSVSATLLKTNLPLNSQDPPHTTEEYLVAVPVAALAVAGFVMYSKRSKGFQVAKSEHSVD